MRRVARSYTTITVSYEVWAELLRRKALLSQKLGRRVSMDEVVRWLLDEKKEEREAES